MNWKKIDTLIVIAALVLGLILPFSASAIISWSISLFLMYDTIKGVKTSDRCSIEVIKDYLILFFWPFMLVSAVKLFIDKWYLLY